jgi:putative transposase
MSERRACQVIGCCRMTMRYEAIRQDDPVLRERLKELARVRRRFGYRRLHVFLHREGHEVNHKRLFRIHCEERLTSGVAAGASGPSARGLRCRCR